MSALLYPHEFLIGEAFHFNGEIYHLISLKPEWEHGDFIAQVKVFHTPGRQHEPAWIDHSPIRLNARTAYSIQQDGMRISYPFNLPLRGDDSKYAWAEAPRTALPPTYWQNDPKHHSYI